MYSCVKYVTLFIISFWCRMQCLKMHELVLISLCQELYKSSCSRIEQQYRRFIEDFTAALLQEKQVILQRMDDTRLRVYRQTESQRADNERCCLILLDLSKGCQEVTEERTTAGILSRASELQPLIVKMKKNRKE